MSSGNSGALEGGDGRPSAYDRNDPAIGTVGAIVPPPGAVDPAAPEAVGAAGTLTDPSGAVGPTGPLSAGRRQRYELWMRRALEVAVTGPELPSTGGPETADIPVGAVLYGPDGAELATGRNERELTGDPTAHAEILALRRAAAQRGEWRLDGCTLVVTLEPCTMCAGALVLARVEAVVFAAWEPKTGAVGSLWDVVRDRRLNHRPEVYGGVLAAESAALLRAFFR